MVHIKYESESRQYVMTCTKCPTVSAADTAEELAEDTQAHREWHGEN